MQITNKLNLPEPLYQWAVEREARYRREYLVDKAVANQAGLDYFTVTELLRPARIARLQEEHTEEITRDVSDMIFLLMGQAIHKILQDSDDEASNYLTETRFRMTLDNKVTISHRIDCLDLTAGVLTDWKNTHVWMAQEFKPKPKDEWVAQLNMAKAILDHNHVLGDECNKNRGVTALEVVGMFFDWSKMGLYRDKEGKYPEHQVMRFPAPIWTVSETMDFIRGRIAEHTQTELPSCTPEERYAEPEKWAVKKRGNKKATKLCDTEEDATAEVGNLMLSSGDKYQIEHRPGWQTKRCELYCEVSQWCSQFRDLKT